jgi:hypothetical protein
MGVSLPSLGAYAVANKQDIVIYDQTNFEIEQKWKIPGQE